MPSVTGSAARDAALFDVLRLIRDTRDDETPVIDAILKNAAQLCEAPFAARVTARPGDAIQRMAANHGAKADIVSYYDAGHVPMDPAKSFAAQAICATKVIHLADIRDTDAYRESVPYVVALAELQNIRTSLFVPLVTTQGAVGCIILARHEVRPFDETQISLVQNFADQAVIAFEKAHQFRALQTRSERETATREVLQVISASRSDPAPVFDVILRNASQLSGAPLANLCLLDADRRHWQLVAHHGDGLRHLSVGKTPRPLDSELTPAVAMRTARVVHVEDLTQTDLYLQGDPGRVAMVDVEGMRSILCVPLLNAGKAVGCITLFRREIQAFSKGEISLVETFAAQAVIAIENVHQFKALETLNAELGDRVDAQVDELERMGRLKRFLPEQVADAVVSSGDDTLLSSHRALIAALFCDIRGFTAFCETAEPEETIEVLQTYHEEMGKLISAHGAGVDHRAGDGIMVLFNDPLPCENPAGDALRLAFAMRATMQELCTRWRKLGHRLGFGVGISLGYATVGMVGSEGRFHYTASGTAVNLAARLCDMAEDGEILLSPRAWIAVEDDTDGQPVGEVEIKGISAPVEVYRALNAIAG